MQPSPHTNATMQQCNKQCNPAKSNHHCTLMQQCNRATHPCSRATAHLSGSTQHATMQHDTCPTACDATAGVRQLSRRQAGRRRAHSVVFAEISWKANAPNSAAIALPCSAVTARRSGRSHLLTAQCRTHSCCPGACCAVRGARCTVHGIARPHLLPSSSTLTVSSHWSCTA